MNLALIFANLGMNYSWLLLFILVLNRFELLLLYIHKNYGQKRCVAN